MLHPTTQAYIRPLLQSRLRELVEELANDDAATIARTVEEIRTVSNAIADLVTHHLDEAPPVEQPREVKAALHLFRNVLDGADMIRDLEIQLGLSDKANTKPHNFLRGMTKFIEQEKLYASQFNDLENVLADKRESIASSG